MIENLWTYFQGSINPNVSKDGLSREQQQANARRISEFWRDHQVFGRSWSWGRLSTNNFNGEEWYVLYVFLPKAVEGRSQIFFPKFFSEIHDCSRTSTERI